MNPIESRTVVELTRGWNQVDEAGGLGEASLHIQQAFQISERHIRKQARTQGVRRTTPNLPKGPLFAIKWAKTWVL